MKGDTDDCFDQFLATLQAAARKWDREVWPDGPRNAAHGLRVHGEVIGELMWVTKWLIKHLRRLSRDAGGGVEAGRGLRLRGASPGGCVFIESLGDWCVRSSLVTAAPGFESIVLYA